MYVQRAYVAQQREATNEAFYDGFLAQRMYYADGRTDSVSFYLLFECWLYGELGR